MELLVFGLFGLVALGCGAGVILSKNPIHSAIFLLICLFSVAGLFVTLWAEFLAVVQVMVYAGGVMVLFLFVIMLVDLERRGLDPAVGRLGPHPTRIQRATWSLLTLVLGVALLVALFPTMNLSDPGAAEAAKALQGDFHADGRALGNTEWLGILLYTSYLLPFELASVLLLVAMVGAVVLARRGE